MTVEDCRVLRKAAVPFGTDCGVHQMDAWEENGPNFFSTSYSK